MFRKSSKALARAGAPLSLLALLLGGCSTVGKDYRAPGPPELGVPERYFGPERSFETSQAGEAQNLATWWTQLGDPLLDSLVARAIAGNLDLAVAESRLRQAREALVQARAARVPTVGASGGLGQSLDSGGNADTNLSLGADAAWEADLFGGISRGIEASRADAAAVAFDLAAVRVAIVGEVATNYIEARQAQARLASARDTLGIADDNLQITRWRVQAGLVSSLDIEQARGQRAQTAASIPSLEREFAAAAYRIAVLTGQAPGSVSGELQAVRPIPLGPSEIATGIPAETLRNRPDIRSAERSLAAATARIGVAQAALLPNLRLTGNIGTSGLSLGNLVDAVTGSLFASLGQTLFDGGRLRSQVRSQRAAAEGAFATYRGTILTALEDVENGLVALQAAKARQREFAVALDAATNQAILARSTYRAGLTDFQTLLEAERSLLSARDGLTSARAEQALALVQLYRALGGGWDPLVAAAPDTRS
ncbi:MAG TPA: efflux transporter outer membrane subunit [Allosphingosinicella sp.]|nr:efflux transporter outer membrane subunit [Allosphingosinicella sp.]